MAGELPALTDELRRAPCCTCNRRGCEPHHPTKDRFRSPRGADRRAHDVFAIPLCHRCHMALHALGGPFKGWTRKRMRDWESDWQKIYRPLRDALSGEATDRPEPF